jgi:hypothetical protein
MGMNAAFLAATIWPSRRIVVKKNHLQHEPDGGWNDFYTHDTPPGCGILAEALTGFRISDI